MFLARRPMNSGSPCRQTGRQADSSQQSVSQHCGQLKHGALAVMRTFAFGIATLSESCAARERERGQRRRQSVRVRPSVRPDQELA